MDKRFYQPRRDTTRKITLTLPQTCFFFSLVISRKNIKYRDLITIFSNILYVVIEIFNSHFTTFCLQINMSKNYDILLESPFYQGRQCSPLKGLTIESNSVTFRIFLEKIERALRTFTRLYIECIIGCSKFTDYKSDSIPRRSLKFYIVFTLKDQ